MTTRRIAKSEYSLSRSAHHTHAASSSSSIFTSSRTCIRRCASMVNDLMMVHQTRTRSASISACHHTLRHLKGRSNMLLLSPLRYSGLSSRSLASRARNVISNPNPNSSSSSSSSLTSTLRTYSSATDNIRKALWDTVEHPGRFEGTTDPGLRMLIFGKPVSRELRICGYVRSRSC